MIRCTTALGCALAVLAIAPAAQASTLNYDGNLFYTAAPSIANTVTLTQGVSGDVNTVTINTPGDPVSNDLPAGCVDNGTTKESITCTNVGNVYVNTDDLNDTIDASGLTTVSDSLSGGTENDTITGGTTGDNAYGGPGNDTISGGAGDDNIYGDDGEGSPGGDDVLDGGPGYDNVRGTAGNDTVKGGADSDGEISGGPGTDTVDGGDGDDSRVYGGPGADVVRGGAGNDSYIDGGCGRPCPNGNPDLNDQIDGGPGDDYITGNDGDDVENGGPGDDGFGIQINDADLGNDTYSGGDGIDYITYRNYNPNNTSQLLNVNVSLDDVANDGREGGEADNVRTDVEDVSINTYYVGPGCPPFCVRSTGPGSGSATITGSAVTNELEGSENDDTLDGKAGNDFIYGYGGDDVIEARDGYADRIDCGPGTDVANVDQFDQVAANCESAPVTQVPNANDVPEDKAPSISWISPADQGTITPPGATLSVNASDDKGVTQVAFLAGSRLLCVDTSAPFTCDFKPQDIDVGKSTLIAIAYDAAQQTASAVRVVTVNRFSPVKVSASTSPDSDTSGKRKFETKGKITLPTGVTTARGCLGRVSVQIKTGKKTLSNRRVSVKKDCSYKSSTTFSLPKRFSTKTLKVVTTFLGNAVLNSQKAEDDKVTVLKSKK